jgi:hypothetical protein
MDEKWVLNTDNQRLEPAKMKFFDTTAGVFIIAPPKEYR